MPDKNTNKETIAEEAPPIFKSWLQFYFVVSANLILLLILFYSFTSVFK